MKWKEKKNHLLFNLRLDVHFNMNINNIFLEIQIFLPSTEAHRDIPFPHKDNDNDHLVVYVSISPLYGSYIYIYTN